MKIAIMQPYLFPYIGYFHLLNSADKFVIFDDVNYINKGWINRNRILDKDKILPFTLPLMGAGQNKLIKDIDIFEKKKSAEKLLKNIIFCYKKSPFFNENFQVIEEIMNFEENNLSKFIANSLMKLSRYLDIKTEFLYSSDLSYDRSLKGQDKIIEILKTFSSSELNYHNLPGGRELYENSVFKDNNISLKFIESEKIKYQQFTDNFIENLSIIDVLMFNSKKDISEFLKKYKTID